MEKNRKYKLEPEKTINLKQMSKLKNFFLNPCFVNLTFKITILTLVTCF